jgi:hypothetical protein
MESLSWLRDVHPTSTFTASVSTGAFALGAAGICTRPPTAPRMNLKEFDAAPLSDRVVTDGKVITAVGVSAGIDMALHPAGLLWGDETAHMIQLANEYDSRPPYTAGSPESAPVHLVKVPAPSLAADSSPTGSRQGKSRLTTRGSSPSTSRLKEDT